MFIDFIKCVLLFTLIKGTVVIAQESEENPYYPPFGLRTNVLPDSCASAYVQRIQVEGTKSFTASCDSDTAGPGWTVIQRRINGQVDFYRNWTEYKEGFGDVEGEFWIGLEKLHLMTNKKRYELYIKLVDQNDETRYARFDNFVIGSEEEKYPLVSIGKYSGTAGNSMGGHVGRPFSTKDMKNDLHKTLNCAEKLKGAWWYFYCADSNLNGKNFACDLEKSNKLEATGCIYWQHWHGRSYSLKNVQMMIRPLNRQLN